MTPYTRSDRATGRAVFGIIAVWLVIVIFGGIAMLLAGCTAEQLAPYRKVAVATTQVADNPLVVVGSSLNPYTLTADRLISFGGNALLAILLLMEKRKKVDASPAGGDPPTN